MYSKCVKQYTMRMHEATQAAVLAKSLHSLITFLIIIYTTTKNHHHTVQIAQVEVRHLRQWVKGKTPPAQVAMGETSTCAIGVFVTKDEGETPAPQVAAGDYHRKHKVQRSGCKVQRSGPASAQVRVGCSNNMQLQTPPPPTSSGSAWALVASIRHDIKSEVGLVNFQFEM